MKRRAGRLHHCTELGTELWLQKMPVSFCNALALALARFASARGAQSGGEQEAEKNTLSRA